MNKNQQHFMNELKKVNQAYLDELEFILVSIYHRVAHDHITLEDIEEIGERFGLDISERYDSMVGQIEDNEEEI